MNQSKSMHSVVLLIALVTLYLSSSTAHSNEDQQPIKRIYSDEPDESSCICGLNRDLLDKLELILRQANSSNQHCSSPTSTNSSHQQDNETSTEKPTQISDTGANSTQIGSQQDGSLSHNGDAPTQQQQHHLSGTNSEAKPIGPDVVANGSTNPLPGGSWPLSGNGSPAGNANEAESIASKLADEIRSLQAQLASLLSNTNAKPNDHTQQPQHVKPTQKPPSISWPSSSSSSNLQEGGSLNNNNNNNGARPVGGSIPDGWGLPASNQISPIRPATNNYQVPNSQFQLQPTLQQQQQVFGNTGFLQGLTPNDGESTLQVPTQSHKVEPQEVQQAVVSTVPNVVSNIFTNIQDLAIKTESNPSKTGDPSSSSASSTATGSDNQLVSIDGESAQLNKNDTASQITAQGEQLFLQWIEHQIQAYHMTASMAAYIRKHALNLFRRIVKQYVQRIERLGGAVEQNVRQATQLALNNTQNLIAFLLRNYLNVAGGLMQIIGEQVSRVGKQLDSTGETIAHINLNPFDIVSNVFDSLPNPSRYSEYFRAFGKYLMGETTSNSGNDQNQQMQQSSTNLQQSQEQANDRPKGLFSKTMGALSKTLGSWIG